MARDFRSYARKTEFHKINSSAMGPAAGRKDLEKKGERDLGVRNAAWHPLFPSMEEECMLRRRCLEGNPFDRLGAQGTDLATDPSVSTDSPGHRLGDIRKQRPETGSSSLLISFSKA